MPSRADAPVFLIGFMASGKTTVGRIVARRLRWRFRDLDQSITEAAGLSVVQIFADEGEEGFRRRESEAVRNATGLRRTIVATGGGAACRDPNLDLMLASGRVVALSVTADEVIRRTGGDRGRPLLSRSPPDHVDPLAVASALLAARESFYARAHHRVDTTGKSAEVVAAEVLRLIEAGSS
jgi:shikimate kinase